MQIKQIDSNPGQRLRDLRRKLGLTLREVAELSRQVATQQANETFSVSHPRLVQIENNKSVPSIFKLFTLSTVYGVPIENLLSAYINPELAYRLHLSMQLPNTHMSAFDQQEQEDEETTLPPPRGSGTPLPRETTLLSGFAEDWGELPISLLAHSSSRKYRYAAIGLSDYRMFPILRPGSLVQIDECMKPAPAAEYRSEYERPIYFVELRSGYLCSWCEVRNGRLLSIPHPLSSCSIQEYEYPSEAEIVGRVTGVALRLVASAPAGRAKPADDVAVPRNNRPAREQGCYAMAGQGCGA